jgi:hypothetical protein
MKLWRLVSSSSGADQIQHLLGTAAGPNFGRSADIWLLLSRIWLNSVTTRLLKGSGLGLLDAPEVHRRRVPKIYLTIMQIPRGSRDPVLSAPRSILRYANGPARAQPQAGLCA